MHPFEIFRFHTLLNEGPEPLRLIQEVKSDSHSWNSGELASPFLTMGTKVVLPVLKALFSVVSLKLPVAKYRKNLKTPISHKRR